MIFADRMPGMPGMTVRGAGHAGDRVVSIFRTMPFGEPRRVPDRWGGIEAAARPPPGVYSATIL
ncbi:hypothetical protein [Jiella sonneratiae]|uniref:Uncharacterized protein n=1 Tax=Jiella sonneratiae TaxID=2816856 RepID=A0ABS3J4B9_9HYPH|nr:hypothetical protein [Jiella sonneratiae]MBO0904516.1 hypothetical protein [Jiella sonneratiae]